MAVLQKIVLGKVKEVFPLSPGTTRIGRGNGNELLLTPAAASKAHARIECFEDHCEISDLDSRNGTLVNGVRISSGYRLQHGDRLDFAGAKFVYLESEAKGSQLEDDEDSLGLSSNVFLNPLKIHTPMPDDHDPEQSIRRKIVRAGDFVSPDDLMEFPGSKDRV
jgi:pSer/pThr/pTyr-binding forkhead associated (FHA) protein